MCEERKGFSINAARATDCWGGMKLSPYFHYTKINTKRNKTRKALTIKKITDKFYHIKMKNFYSRHNFLKSKEKEKTVDDD